MEKKAQESRIASVSTAFGKDVLLLDSCSGKEALSKPFRFVLRMRSANKSLDAAAVVGKRATITLQRPQQAQRQFDGIVAQFSHLGADLNHGYYSAELRPKLWLLTLGCDRVIYQNKSTPTIIKEILARYDIAYEMKLQANAYPPRPYCVQYDESPFDFISRLMEEEGIFYFFDQADGKHTMVIADGASAYQRNARVSKLHICQQVDEGGETNRVHDFQMAHGLAPAKHAQADYDYTTGTLSHAESAGRAGAPAGRRYLYPGKHSSAKDGDRKAAVRSAAQQVDQQIGTGASHCCALAAGYRFELSGHPQAALNVSYVLRAVTHEISNHGYENNFAVLPEAVPFRAPLATPRPRVAGSHTALVVGPSGEEIWTDSYGRVKLKFHWDDSPSEGQDSSCWVRVSQAIAGQGWGSWVLPRVGQEVVVSYVDGDPDQPLVTGAVYNKQDTLPLQLPAAQTQSLMRSRSSKRGSAGNEIRMEDKLNAEELYLRAQKDMTVSVENSLATTVEQGNQSLRIKKGDLSVDVQSGKETHDVKGARGVTVGGDEKHVNKAAYVHEVSGDFTLKVGGNLLIDVTGAVKIKARASLSAESAGALSTKGLTIEHKASATQTIDGGGLLALKGGLVKVN